jgi:alpha-D-ribose 1-methylphosphonate 5-triphosphate synthase subunit PhnG
MSQSMRPPQASPPADSRGPALSPATTEDRALWMSVLAQSSPAEVATALDRLRSRPAYRVLRRPQTGLVLVRGRAGSTGIRFDLGELPVTCCSVELAGGTVGHAYVGGRNHAHAELAAVVDALLQDPAWRASVERVVIAPLAALRRSRREAGAGGRAERSLECFASVSAEE